VYAFRSELDTWWARRAQLLDSLSDPTNTEGDAVALKGEGMPTLLAQPSTQSRRRFGRLAAGFALLCGATAVGWLVLLPRDGPRQPFANARFHALTDFEGSQGAAAISRDGAWIAFLADRDGPMDVWVTRVGSGEFRNLTHGAMRELVNPSIRVLGFSPDARLTSFWIRRPSGSNPGRRARAVFGRCGGIRLVK
jgi:hypothetical protein